MEPDFGRFDVILLDIEGTICPISFVKDVLFPFALEALPSLLSEKWDESGFAAYRDAFPEQYRNDRLSFETHVRDLVTRDVKASYLKALQGYIWKKGYESGVLKAPLFPDVPQFILNAHAAGKKIMIYSSGSVPAQKLLFAHTNANPSDMSYLISDWFDTVNAGPKIEPVSYRAILSQYPDIKPARWIFLSDNLLEVDAARKSGMQSIPAARPGNALLPLDHPLSGFAISEFTPETVENAAASIEAKST